MRVVDNLTARLTTVHVNQPAWIIIFANCTLRGEDLVIGLNTDPSVVSAYGTIFHAILGSFNTSAAPWLESL
jgi:hypothetical protein